MPEKLKIKKISGVKITGNAGLRITNIVNNLPKVISNNDENNNDVTKTASNDYIGTDYYNTLVNGDKVYASNESPVNTTVSNLFDNKINSWTYGWQSENITGNEKATIIYNLINTKTITSIKFYQPSSSYRSGSLTIYYGDNGISDSFSELSITSTQYDLNGMDYGDERIIRFTPVTTRLIKLEIGRDTTLNNNYTGLFEIEIFGY